MLWKLSGSCRRSLSDRANCGSVAKAAELFKCASHRLSSGDVGIVLRCHQYVVQNCAHSPCDLPMLFASCLCQSCFFWCMWSAAVAKVTCGASSNRLPGQACRTSLLCIRISPAVVTPQKHNRDTTFYDFAVGIAVELSSSFDAGLCVVE